MLYHKKFVPLSLHNGASRKQNQIYLAYAEAPPIFAFAIMEQAESRTKFIWLMLRRRPFSHLQLQRKYNNGASRKQNQICLCYAEAPPIFAFTNAKLRNKF